MTDSWWLGVRYILLAREGGTYRTRGCNARIMVSLILLVAWKNKIPEGDEGVERRMEQSDGCGRKLSASASHADVEYSNNPFSRVIGVGIRAPLTRLWHFACDYLHEAERSSRRSRLRSTLSANRIVHGHILPSGEEPAWVYKEDSAGVWIYACVCVYLRAAASPWSAYL